MDQQDVAALHVELVEVADAVANRVDDAGRLQPDAPQQRLQIVGEQPSTRPQSAGSRPQA